MKKIGKIWAILTLVIMTTTVFTPLSGSTMAGPQNGLTPYASGGIDYGHQVSGFFSGDSDDSSPANRLLTLSIGDSIRPIIMSDANSALYMVWLGTSEINNISKPAIFFKHSTNYGETWSADTVLSARGTALSNLRMTVDGQSLAIAWEEQKQNNVYVMYSLNKAATWSQPYKISHAISPSIAVSGLNIYLSFENVASTTDSYISGARISVSPGNPPQIYNFNPTGSHISCSGDITSDGNYVHFAIRDNKTGKIYYYRGANNGTIWTGGVLTDSYGDDSPDSIKILARGTDVRLLWSDNRDGDYNLYLKSSSDFGQTWSDDTRITTSSADSLNPSIGVDSESESHISWEEHIGNETKIMYEKIDSEGKILQSSEIADGTSHPSYPSVAVDSTDHYYLVWQGQGNSGTGEEVYFSTSMEEFEPQIDAILQYIETIPTEYFVGNSSCLKSVLIKKVQTVQKMLSEGDYNGAKNKIQNDILKKMDGYDGGNQRNDWITDFSTQEELSGLISNLLTLIDLKLEGDSDAIGGSEFCDVGTASDADIKTGIYTPTRYPNSEWSGISTEGSRTFRVASNKDANILLNIIESETWDENTDYRITLTYKASSDVTVRQFSADPWYNYIGTLPGTSSWNTYTVETNHLWNHDYLSTTDRMNVLFDFGAPLYLDSIAVVPVNHHCDVGTAGDNDVYQHDPGVSIYPNTQWSASQTIDGKTCRIGTYLENGGGPNLYVNSPDTHMEYRLTMTYKTLKNRDDIYLQQYFGVWPYTNIGKLNGDTEWHTSTFIIKHISGGRPYYDYRGDSNLNVLFQIGYGASTTDSTRFGNLIAISSLKLTAARDFCSIANSDYNTAIYHEPGVSIYPAEWGSPTTVDGKTCLYGPAYSNFYLNEVDTSKDYVIRITYKSSSVGTDGHLRQWNGSAYHAIGTYARDGQWHTATFIAKAFWAYDYNGAGHTWGMNELFEFNSGVYVSEVSVGVMEKYAILIGGGDTDASKNFDAFWIDTKEMYNVLVNQYGYHPENVYLQFWDHQKGYKDGIYIDGPAEWEVNANNLSAYGLGINQTLELLRAKMTEDDFFYLFINSHGGDTGYFQGCFVQSDGRTVNARVTYANPGGSDNLNREIDKMTYVRSVMVIAACYSGTAINGTSAHPEWNMKGEKRIIITNTNRSELGHLWGDTPYNGGDDHIEFLWNGDKNGFVYSLKNSDTISIRAAYESGRVAALDGDGGSSHAHIYQAISASNTYL